MRELINPKEYLGMTVVEFEDICNGAGSSQAGFDFIPDTMYGLDLNDAANRHDFMYHYGYTAFEKLTADAVYLWNMFSIIEDASWFWSWLRKNRALKYAGAVNLFGDSSYFLEEKANLLEEDKTDRTRDWGIIKDFLDSKATSYNYKKVMALLYNKSRGMYVR